MKTFSIFFIRQYQNKDSDTSVDKQEQLRFRKFD